MAETLQIDAAAPKAARYAALLPQIAALIADEPDLSANLANVSAALRDAFGWWWVGFYLVKPGVGKQAGRDELVLGPFQGPIACTRIAYGRGVCGTTWKQGATIVVPDVEQFPGHIACSAASRSEIVVPGFKDGQVFLVLDVDSEHLAAFDDEDKKSLEALMRLLEAKF